MRHIRRHTLVIGIALMFALTWPFYAALGLFVGWGLSLAALMVVTIAEGRTGLRSLLRRYLIWRVPFGWYLFALGGPCAIYLVALALFTLATGSRPDPSLAEARAIFGPGANVWLLAIPFFVFDALTNGEELAWRGFVLPRLQARSSALLSSLLLGAIWGVWHLPKFWAARDVIGIAYVIVHNVLAAILYSWVFNSTGGSLLLVTLLHAAYNTAYVCLPVDPNAAGSQLILVFVLGAELLAAMAVLSVNGGVHLSRRWRVQQADLIG